jgi:hypothetical protein
MSSKCCLPTDLSTKILYTFLVSYIQVTRPAYRVFLNFTVPKIQCRSQRPRGLRHELSSPLKDWDGGFEPQLRHGCLCAFILCLCCPVCRVAALRRADPPSNESYRLCKSSRNCKAAKVQQRAVERLVNEWMNEWMILNTCSCQVTFWGRFPITVQRKSTLSWIPPVSPDTSLDSLHKNNKTTHLYQITLSHS